MLTRSPILIVCLAILLSAPVVRGGIVVLKDGTRIEGEIKRTPDGWAITLADGKARRAAARAGAAAA